MSEYIVTGTSMVVEADDEHEAVDRAQDSSGWHWEAELVSEKPEPEKPDDDYGPFDSGPSTIVLGDYVETDHHGHRGRVTDIHHFCPQGAAWLMGQEIPIPRELRDRRWISVLCEPAGAVVVPMSLAKVVEPFPFTNSYADVYFREGS